MEQRVIQVGGSLNGNVYLTAELEPPVYGLSVSLSMVLVRLDERALRWFSLIYNSPTPCQKKEKITG